MKTLSTIDKHRKSRSPWERIFQKEETLNFLAIQEESESKGIMPKLRRKEPKECKKYWLGTLSRNQEPFDHKSLRKILDLLCENIRRTQTEIIFVEQEKNDEDQFTISERRFKGLIPSLLQDHRGKYLAVVGNNPYEIGEDEDELFDLVTEKYGDIPMYLGRIISDDERPIIVMPPKIAINGE